MGGAVNPRRGHPDGALGSEREKPAQTQGPGTPALQGRPGSTQARGPGTSALRGRAGSTQARGPGTSALRGGGKWSRFLFVLPCRSGWRGCCD